eukprot:12071773-Alexandrium_andersonii.AAC.1
MPKRYAPSHTSSSPARNRRRLAALSCVVSPVPCWGLSRTSHPPGWTLPCSCPLCSGGAARL